MTNKLNALARLTIAEAAPLIEKRQLSPMELTRACIDAAAVLDPLRKAYITPTFASALAEAKRSGEEIARGKYRGPMHGIPVALKDLFETAGVLTTAASPLRKDHIPSEDAEVVRRLRAAGAISLGKLNMHEWALGTTNINASYPTARNPWDTSRITGGSSGGSGAAVAAGLCFGSLGSDTGGSVRIPASLCGISGLKPTFGRISTRGAVPLAWSLDHVGPMARSAADCAILLEAVAGFDALDPLSADVPAPDYTAFLERGAEGLRIGVPTGHFWEHEQADAEVAPTVRHSIAVFEKLGSMISEIDLPEVIYSDDLRFFLAEAAAYHETRLRESPNAFGPSVYERLEPASHVTGPEYASARLRQMETRRALRNVFESFDLLLLPATLATADRIPESPADVGRAALLGRNTRPFNIAGVPAISIPCGFSTLGLPIGLQLVGPSWAEGTVLRAAHAYQQATDWHRRVPAVVLR